jgi:hypothetical protein
MHDTTTEDDPQQWADWPLCPECQHRRQAICDSCQFPGNDFPLAEFMDSIEIAPIGQFENGEHVEAEPRESTPRILLMCPQCDEAFPPRFYRQCQWCGHEFESGRRIDSPITEPLTPQAIWTIFALAVFCVGALGWFIWVTSQ